LNIETFDIVDKMIAPLQNLKDQIKLIVLSIRGNYNPDTQETRLGKFCIDIENKIKSLNIPYVIVRHALEYEYLLYFNATLIPFRGVNTTPVKLLNWVSAQDIATCIVNIIYKQNLYVGKTFDITSRKHIEPEEISDCLSNSVRQVIPVVVIEEEDFKDTISTLGFTEEKCDFLIEQYQHFQNTNISNDINDLLGKDPEEFQTWSDKNAHEFV